MEKADLVLIRAFGLDDGNKALPFGLLSLSSYLEKFGYAVKIIDRHTRKLSFSQILKYIEQWNPRYVGISAITSQADDALKLGKYINKRFKKPIVYGGLHFSVSPEEGLDTGKIVVRGEGENALLEILNNSVKDIMVHTAKPIDDLDSIPLPKESLIKSLACKVDPFAILTSRGCPYSCLFCLSKEYRDNRLRYHSVEYVLDFIELVKKTLNISAFSIMDDIFTVSEERVFEFCNAIHRRGLKIKLGCFSRIGINNLRMYEAMKDAGFYNIGLGIESGNDDVLKAINKNQTVEGARRTVEIIKKAGLGVSATFMIGNITETEKTIRDTINFAKELPLCGWHVGYAQPFPGSRFYEVASNYGILVNKNPKTYWNNDISFLPYGLTIPTLKKLHKEFFEALRHKQPLLFRVLNKIGFKNH
jgi:anaerobic magnesium-protoporphyrin IX monomethyl ester cyclase